MQIISRYSDDPALRELLCQFTDLLFPSADFRSAYAIGGWGPTFFPMSIVEDGRIVSNVAWSEMNVLLSGRELPAIQLATVGTLPEYRERGYSRVLMERLMAEHEKKTELMFLYGNDTVLDFYPRFGFELTSEWLFHTHVSSVEAMPKTRLLDISQSGDLRLLQNLAHERIPVTRLFGASNYAHALLWQVANGLAPALQYLDEENILVCCEQEGAELHIYDVLALESFSFREILPLLLPGKEISEVIFHFSPDLLDSDAQPWEPSTEDPFFVRGDFPIRHQEFKFPSTAQT